MTYKIGTVCMFGSVTGGKFKSADGTIMGVVRQGTLDTLVESKQHTVAFNKIVEKVKQNLNALRSLVKTISVLPEDRRMLRIGSNLLPMYDHPTYGAWYDAPISPERPYFTLKTLIEAHLAYTRKIIEDADIRVVCHPDQYCIVNSRDENTRHRSLLCLEMHRYWMSQLTTPERGAINVHFSGHLDHVPEWDNDPDKYADLIQWISFENDDTLPHAKTQARAGLDDTLAACDKYGIKMCFDMHHYFVESGEFLPVDDPRVQRIVDTWNGQRPVMHLSQSKEPDGTTPQQLAKHSDMITDQQLIEYSADFLKIADVEIEAKHKNIAVADYASKVKRYM